VITTPNHDAQAQTLAEAHERLDRAKAELSQCLIELADARTWGKISELTEAREAFTAAWIERDNAAHSVKRLAAAWERRK
jgi:hypothetical protein